MHEHFTSILKSSWHSKIKIPIVYLDKNMQAHKMEAHHPGGAVMEETQTPCFCVVLFLRVQKSSAEPARRTSSRSQQLVLSFVTSSCWPSLWVPHPQMWPN